MSFRLKNCGRRLLGLGAGLLLCASVGCNTGRGEKQQVVNAPTKPMGPGNGVINPPTSPVFNNLNGNPGGTVNYQQSPPYVNAPGANVPMMGNRGTTNMPMQNVQMPQFNQQQNTSFHQPMMQPNYGPQGQMNQFGQPGVAPMTNQGVPQMGGPGFQPVHNHQGMNGPNLMAPGGGQLVPPQQPGNFQNVPATPNTSMNGLKIPDTLPTSVTGLEGKGMMPAGPQLLQVSGTDGPGVAPPPDTRTSVKVTDLSPAKRAVPVAAPAEEEVIAAPLTHITIK